MSSATLKLWDHLFGELEGGYLVTFTGKQSEDPDARPNELDDTKQRSWSWPKDREKAAEYLQAESDRGRDAYFGAHLFRDRGNRRKDNAAEVLALWVDGDGAEVPEDWPQPTAVIESSPGRHHYYWKLTRPISPEEASRLNRRLCYGMGGDKGKWGLGTVLRAPGTRNYKRETPTEVRELSGGIIGDWEPEVIDQAIPLIEEPSRNGTGKTGASETDDEPPVALSQARLKVYRGEDPKLREDGKIDRSGSLLKIGRVLYDAGANRPVIEEALRERDAALGWEKYTGRDDAGVRYAEIGDELAKNGRNTTLQVLSGGRETAGEIMSVGNPQGLPKIIVNNRHLRDMTADALGALEAANTPPAVFVRSGRLVRIQDDENGTPVITTLTDNHVKGRLARVADCVKVYKDKDEVRETRVSPPDVVVRDIQALDRFPFPPLEAVVETPVVRPDGTIFDTPGYDPATRLYYHPAPGFAPRAVPDQPTVEELQQALEVLHEAVGEFPYADGSSAANTLALMLTGLLRQAVDLVPLALIDKPQAGTGGSLLAEVVALVGTGRPADMFGAPSRDDEWSKKLTAKFASGSTMLIIDNVDGALYAPSLARALTSRSWTDRVLGLSEMITVRQRATWIATGNNIQLQGDLPRRCYWVRLDAKASRPWEREGFRHPDLLRWVGENRDQLVHALLTLIRSWYAAGKPKDSSLPRLGSFEAWAETVGGVLAHAGVEGFLGNLEALYSKADEGGAEWEAFLDAWWRTWGEDGKTVKAVAEAATKAGGLGDALPGELAEALGKNEGSFTRKLGKALASRIGTRYGDEGLHVEETGTYNRSKVWSVFKGSDGTKAYEFMSFMSFCESREGKSSSNGEINYPPPPQTNSTNSETHNPDEPIHRDPEAFWGETY